MHTLHTHTHTHTHTHAHTHTHSQTRQLYFVQESALHELFKFAAQYSEEIIDGLNEEGLSIMATNFQ